MDFEIDRPPPADSPPCTRRFLDHHGKGNSNYNYSHFSLVRTISGKEKILYYRELLVSENFFKKRWIPPVLPSTVIWPNFFCYREFLVSEKCFV